MPNEAWKEGQICIDFSGGIHVWKPDHHENSLKTVDFIASYPGELWLIELKDPEAAAPHARGAAINQNLAEVQNDQLRKTHLLPKLFGTYVYLVESGKEPRERVRYGCLICLTNLTAADRTVVTDKIQWIVDRIGPKVVHSPICEVHNLDSWNDAHPTMMAVRHETATEL